MCTLMATLTFVDAILVHVHVMFVPHAQDVTGMGTPTELSGTAFVLEERHDEVDCAAGPRKDQVPTMVEVSAWIRDLWVHGRDL